MRCAMKCSIALSVLLLATTTLAALPDQVDIPDGHQAANLYNEYAIESGKLYEREDASRPWKLTDGIGLPNHDGTVIKQLHGQLTRVFADGNVVLVTDEQDQVFRLDTGLSPISLEKKLY